VTSPDAARAADLDAAHVKWSQTSLPSRPPFGTFAVNFLLGRDVEVRPAAPTAADLQAVSPCLPESPFVEQALDLGVEDVADLLAALAERDLQWTPAKVGDECGTLHEVQPEPPDLHVVFDCFRTAWQRDDHRAGEMHMIEARWFGPSGAARGWLALRRDLGPLTPRDGIAPTTPAVDES
jgi:hypothetical protein